MQGKVDRFGCCELKGRWSATEVLLCSWLNPLVQPFPFQAYYHHPSPHQAAPFLHAAPCRSKTPTLVLLERLVHVVQAAQDCASRSAPWRLPPVYAVGHRQDGSLRISQDAKAVGHRFAVPTARGAQIVHGDGNPIRPVDRVVP